MKRRHRSAHCRIVTAWFGARVVRIIIDLQAADVSTGNTQALVDAFKSALDCRKVNSCCALNFHVFVDRRSSSGIAMVNHSEDCTGKGSSFTFLLNATLQLLHLVGITQSSLNQGHRHNADDFIRERSDLRTLSLLKSYLTIRELLEEDLVDL